MTLKLAKIRAEKLRAEIDRIRYDYHVLDKETVSEAVKSSLMHELSQIEEQFPEIVTPESPTQRVAGEPIKGFKKITHKYPGMSLNDVFSTQELFDWEKRVTKLLGRTPASTEVDSGGQKLLNSNYSSSERSESRSSRLHSNNKLDYFAELKIDGLSVYLTYEKGLLKHAATRGNGKVGEDVTVNVRTIEAVPLRLKLDSRLRGNDNGGNIEVRGEVFMSYKEFERVNKDQEKAGLQTYANPRNLAAGTLRQLDPKIVAERKLDFAAWAVFGSAAKSHEDEHKLARELGFRVESHAKKCRDLNEVIKFVNDWEERRKKLDYQTDGIVININSNELHQKLGIVGKAPRGSAAWKYSAEQGTTKILEIRVNVGRTGAITPFAVMEPVQLAGTTVTRATLHNEDEINRKDIRIGDTVIVQKAGDIIPEVVESLPNLRTGKEKKFVMPKVCPVCGGPVVKPEGEAVARCAATDCFAIEQQKVGHFVSRDAFNIEGLGEKIIEQLFSEGLISDASDLFKLTEGDLEPLERFAEKSAQNLIESIKLSTKITLNRFVYGLGIRFVGAVTANDIANHFGSLDAIKNASQEDLEAIEGVGPVAAKSVYEWFNSLKNLKLLDKLEEYGVQVQKTEHKIKNTKLEGQTFVITGSLETMSRDEAEQKIRELGGKATSSVSAATSYLVVGENPGSKLAKAEKFGVKIIDERDLVGLLNS